MTLKTLTGPSIQSALADARRLLGADVVLLQSTPGGGGTPASVTVAYDQEPRPPAPAQAAPPAVPEPAAPPARRAYGYGNVRQVRPALEEPLSAPAHGPPSPAEPAGAHGQSPAPPSEVAALRARLADLEAALAEVRAAAPPPAPARPPLVVVGRAGSGKTTLALRLAQSPGRVGSETVAALVVAPESGPFLDPAPSFWDAGVPVAVVRSAADVADAMRLFADADRLVVDTPGLPRQPDAARAAVARLGAVLAPLAAVEVVLVADVSRPTATWSPRVFEAIGLTPDALALTRLDEATAPPSAWKRALGLPVRFASRGPGLGDLMTGQTPAAPAQAGAPPAVRLDPSRLAPPPSVHAVTDWCSREPAADVSVFA